MASSDMSDDDFLTAFLDCSISPALFNHHGHMRVAWLMLRRYPLDEAVERTCSGIVRLAAHLGVPDKFHRTLSEALVRLMAAGGAADPAVSFEQFLRTGDPLLVDARSVLARHYSAQALACPAARERFLAPDLLPLPRLEP
jgi:N-formylglutamate deformylase